MQRRSAAALLACAACLCAAPLGASAAVRARNPTGLRAAPRWAAPARARRAAPLALDDATAEQIANVLTAVPLVLPLGAAYYATLAAERGSALREARSKAQELDALKRSVKLDGELASRAATLEARVGTLQARLELSETELRRTKERLRVTEGKAKADAQRVADELVRVEQRLSRAVLPEPPAAPHRLTSVTERPSASSPEAERVQRLGRGDARERKLRRLQPGLQVNEVVLVLGAPEPMAVLAASAILDRVPGVIVRATVPSLNGTEADAADAAVLRSLASKRLQIVECDLLSPASLRDAMDEVGAVVYCASSTGSFPARAASPLGQLLARVVTLTSGKYVEEEGVRLAADTFARHVTVAPQLARAMTPKFVLLSAAGITRSEWSREKRRALPELPVDTSALALPRRRGEEAVRASGLPYAIVRACGASASAPRGRTIFSSGDLATGPIARQDAVDALADVLTTQTATWKTFEVQGVPGLAPLPPRATLEYLPLDSDGAPFTTGYAVLQQLRPP
ncbi:hypothetical protein KFE25_002516 [Diacronema lutheri]|uniref:NAD(P)-binding domain-containing protein n=2 Tax=Diacronema lutheri TaxID=2081491 RepID=A0A8J5XEA6_DIALT|nr:hypothetical protein KFE25_002516 [Diacronema lutheri]